jgi:hypothetical protein
LEIEGGSFRNTKVLHVIGHRNPGFFTDPEKMVNSSSAGKNHCGMIQNINFLLSEFFRRDPFNLNERPKINLHIVLFRQVKVRGFWC